MTQLSDIQIAVLIAAATQTHGKLERFPPNVNGGARAKVLRPLLLAGLIVADGAEHWLTDTGYRAIGLEPPAATRTPPPHVEAPTEEAPPAAATMPTRPGRANSKQALILTLLQRPEGATIAQICESTGWMKHTVRGTFAGVFRKKLRLNLASVKAEGGERVYRISPGSNA